MEVYPEKADGVLHHVLSAVVIVLHCLTNFDDLPTQEFVGQSHDQNQTFPLDQTCLEQNKHACTCICSMTYSKCLLTCVSSEVALTVGCDRQTDRKYDNKFHKGLQTHKNNDLTYVWRLTALFGFHLSQISQFLRIVPSPLKQKELSNYDSRLLLVVNILVSPLTKY